MYFKKRLEIISKNAQINVFSIQKSFSNPLLIFARFWLTQGFVVSGYKRTYVLILRQLQHFTFNKILINHGIHHTIPLYANLFWSDLSCIKSYDAELWRILRRISRSTYYCRSGSSVEKLWKSGYFARFNMFFISFPSLLYILHYMFYLLFLYENTSNLVSIITFRNRNRSGRNWALFHISTRSTRCN